MLVLQVVLNFNKPLYIIKNKINIVIDMNKYKILPPAIEEAISMYLNLNGEKQDVDEVGNMLYSLTTKYGSHITNNNEE